MSTRRHPILWLGASLACAALVGACATGKADDDGGGGDGAGQPDGGFVPQADAAPRPDAMPAVMDVTLTQSTSMTVQDDNSLACADGFGFTTESSYYRVFDLAAAGITRPLTIDNVKIGIEAAQSFSGGGQPASVRLHTLNGEFILANLSELDRAELTVADQGAGVLDVAMSATAPAGSTLVVEFFVPDGTGPGNTLFPGSNPAGQSAASYVRTECADRTRPVDLETILPADVDMHLVMAVEGSW